jgi:hypothetical protein
VIDWYGVAGKGVFDDQVGWLTAGVAILLVTLYSLSSLVIRGRRAVGERRSRLIADEIGDILPRLSASSQNREAVLEGDDVAVVAGLSLYHLPDCPMVVGRGYRRLPVGSAVQQGIEPCGICSGALA